MIDNIAKEFNKYYKINTIHFVNTYNNNVTIDILKINLRLVLNGDLLHCKCCYILILTVQECIDCIRPNIENMRSTILFIQTSPKKIHKFRHLCAENGLKFKNFK